MVTVTFIMVQWKRLKQSVVEVSGADVPVPARVGVRVRLRVLVTGGAHVIARAAVHATSTSVTTFM